MFPRSAISDGFYVRDRYSKFFGDLSKRAPIAANFGNDFGCKFLGKNLTAIYGAMLQFVFLIVAARIPEKIFKSIVGRFSIKMAAFVAALRFPDKC